MKHACNEHYFSWLWIKLTDGVGGSLFWILIFRVKISHPFHLSFFWWDVHDALKCWTEEHFSGTNVLVARIVLLLLNGMWTPKYQLHSTAQANSYLIKVHNRQMFLNYFVSIKNVRYRKLKLWIMFLMLFHPVE